MLDVEQHAVDVPSSHEKASELPQVFDMQANYSLLAQ